MCIKGKKRGVEEEVAGHLTAIVGSLVGVQPGLVVLHEPLCGSQSSDGPHS